VDLGLEGEAVKDIPYEGDRGDSTLYGHRTAFRAAAARALATGRRQQVRRAQSVPGFPAFWRPDSAFAALRGGLWVVQEVR
jgi:hypothetical protein